MHSSQAYSHCVWRMLLMHPQDVGARHTKHARKVYNRGPRCIGTRFRCRCVSTPCSVWDAGSDDHCAVGSGGHGSAGCEPLEAAGAREVEGEPKGAEKEKAAAVARGSAVEAQLQESQRLHAELEAQLEELTVEEKRGRPPSDPAVLLAAIKVAVGVRARYM